MYHAAHESQTHSQTWSQTIHDQTWPETVICRNFTNHSAKPSYRMLYLRGRTAWVQFDVIGSADRSPMVCPDMVSAYSAQTTVRQQTYTEFARV